MADYDHIFDAARSILAKSIGREQDEVEQAQLMQAMVAVMITAAEALHRMAAAWEQVNTNSAAMARALDRLSEVAGPLADLDPDQRNLFGEGPDGAGKPCGHDHGEIG